MPFELGRPFGEPNNAAVQLKVLRAALSLLDNDRNGPILEDYPDPDSLTHSDPDWACPIPAEANQLLDEVAIVERFHERAMKKHGRTTVGICGLSLREAAEFILRYDSETPMPNPKGMAAITRSRFAIDDIKAFYLEAATAGEGHPGSKQLADWFWNTTLAASAIREFVRTSRASGNESRKTIANSSLIPAERNQTPGT